MCAILIIYFLYIAFQAREKMDQLFQRKGFYVLIAIMIGIGIDGYVYFNLFKQLIS